MNKIYLLLLLTCCLLQPLVAQNIISNPGFEISNPLPTNPEELDNAANWTCLIKTCDLLNEVTFPNHPWATQSTPGAHTGSSYAGFYGNGSVTFEAIVQELSSPVLTGTNYEVSVFAKSSWSGFLQTCQLNIEIYGLNEMIPYQEDAHLSNSAAATLLWSSATFSDIEWTNLRGSFTAPDDFSYIAITGPVCLPTTSGYFFLDDLEITSATNPPPPSSSCGAASYAGRSGIPTGNIFNPQIVDNGGSPIVSFYQANITLDVNTLIQLDEKGNVEWAKTYQYPSNVRSADVAITSDGGIVNISSISNNMDVQKVNETGELLWAKRYDNTTSDGSVSSLVVDDNDGLLITGTIGSVFSTGRTDGFLLKTEANGEVAWSRKYDSNLPDPTDIYFADAVLQDDGGLVLTGRANDLPLIARTSNLGDIIWARVFAEDMPLIARSLALNHNNDGFYLIYNGGPLIAGTIKIVEFTLDGDFIRGREFTSPGLGAGPSHLVVQPNGNILLHGDFDTGFGTAKTPFMILLNEGWNILEARAFNNYADEETDNRYGKSFIEIDGELIAVHALFDGSFDFSILKLQNDLEGDCPSESLDFSFTDFTLSPENFSFNVSNEILTVQDITPTITDETITQSFVCNEVATDDFTDVSVAIVETNCTNGNVSVEIEICNEGTTEIPLGLPIAFYEVDPTTTVASVVAETTLPFALLPDACFSQIFSWSGGENFFVVANADASQTTPFNLANGFTGSILVECDYENNFAQTVINTSNAAILNLGDDLFFCETQSVTLDASNDFTTYLWNTGETTAQVTVATAGTYTVEVTDNCGLVQTDEITVNFSGANPVDLGEDFTVCAGESVLLDAGNYASYQWSENLDGSCETCQLFVYLAVIDQTVTVEVTDFNGCVSTDTINIEAQGTLIGSQTVTICEGDSIEINGTFYAEADNISFFTDTNNGCDSLAIVSLLVEESILTSETLTFCTGQTATVFGEIYSQDTLLTETFSSQNGCDSTHAVNLIFTSPDSTFTLLQPCEGEVIVLDGIPVMEDAVLTTTTADPSGCIAYEETIVEFQSTFMTAETQEFCEGTVVEINQTIYTDEATIEIALTAANGCDSTHIIDLVFIENVSSSENLQACVGETVIILGQAVSEDTVLTETLTAQNGCDSTHQISVEFLEPVFSFETIQSCAGQPVEAAGTTFFNDTTIILNLTSSFDCDSTHQIDIQFLNEVSTAETQVYCEGDLVTIGGIDYSENATVTEALTGQNGCDSIHTITLIFNQNVSTNEFIESCEGESITVFGNEISESQIVSANFQAANGCDSIHTVEIVFLETTFSAETQEYCSGDTVLIFGNVVTETDVVIGTFIGENGCDSLHEVTVIFNEIIEINRVETLCPNEFLLFFGDTIREAGTYQNITPATSDDCEIIETVEVNFLPAFNYRLPTDTTIQVGSFFQIPLEVAGNNLTFSWNNAEALSCNNCQRPNLIVEESTSFSVLILDANNCLQQATIQVFAKEKERFFIPNIFSPNNDGINDYFTISSNTTNAVVEKAQIFNRWGGLVFESNNMNLNEVNSGWDGTFKGQLMDAGVFVYQIEIRMEDGRQELFIGDVTLLR
ncbi:MAG: gliding motility-associated C-terminal domain-containing protein [Bacteroidota bacterium]